MSKDRMLGCYGIGATRIFAAVSMSRLIVPPFTLTMHWWPPPLQSNSSSDPGNTPRLAIFAQVARSPFTAQTLSLPLQQVSCSGVPG